MTAAEAAITPFLYGCNSFSTTNPHICVAGSGGVTQWKGLSAAQCKVKCETAGAAGCCDTGTQAGLCRWMPNPSSTRSTREPCTPRGRCRGRGRARTMQARTLPFKITAVPNPYQYCLTCPRCPLRISAKVYKYGTAIKGKRCSAALWNLQSTSDNRAAAEARCSSDTGCNGLQYYTGGGQGSWWYQGCGGVVASESSSSWDSFKKFLSPGAGISTQCTGKDTATQTTSPWLRDMFPAVNTSCACPHPESATCTAAASARQSYGEVKYACTTRDDPNSLVFNLRNNYILQLARRVINKAFREKQTPYCDLSNHGRYPFPPCPKARLSVNSVDSTWDAEVGGTRDVCGIVFRPQKMYENLVYHVSIH